MSAVGKMLVLFGAALVVLGVLLWLGAKVPLLGKLPGDIRIEGRRHVLYFPIATCILLSIVLTMLLNVLGRFFLRR
jgi:hypothetical protein